MAMRELLRVTLNAKQIREACEEWAEKRTGLLENASLNVEGIKPDAFAEVIYTKTRAPRKAKNGVASAQPLSEAEQRY